MQKPNSKQWYGGQQLLSWRLWPDALDFSPPLYSCAAASVTDAGFSNLEAYTKTQSVLTHIYSIQSTIPLLMPQIKFHRSYCTYITLVKTHNEYHLMNRGTFLGFLWFCNTALLVLKRGFDQKTRTRRLFCGMCLALKMVCTLL